VGEYDITCSGGKVTNNYNLATYGTGKLTIIPNPYSGGNGTEADPFLISSKKDMETLADSVNSGNTYSGVYLLLTKNLIDTDTITTVIGDNSPFSGVFDGGGHKIHVNIRIVAGYAGVFGIAANATIKNLSIYGRITGLSAGGICGTAWNASIVDCYNAADIFSSSVVSAGAPSEMIPAIAGGICGDASNTSIVNCYNTGYIYSSSNYSSSNYAYTYSKAGGICGICATDTITNCYNTGNVSATSKTQTQSSRAADYPSANSNSQAGGIYSGGSVIINNCYNAGDVSSSSSSIANALYESDKAYSYSYSGGITGVGGNQQKIKDCFNAGYISSSAKAQSNNKTLNSHQTANSDGICPGSTIIDNCYSTDNTDISSFQSQSWIEENLKWDFSEIWKMSDINSVFKGFPIFKNQEDLIINKMSQIITFDALPEKTYGDSAFALQASVDSNLPIVFESSDTNVATISGDTLTIHNAGTAYITASVAGDNNYYTADSVQQLTVNKAPLTITAEDKQRKQGEDNPSFTLSYSGFKNNENESVLDILPTIYCAANINSPVGFYDIVLSGDSDNNYSYTLINGKLEVTSQTGLAEIKASNISVYPNPAKHYLYIKSDKPIKKIEIYNQSGACVLMNESVMEKLDISRLANGAYLARIYVNGGAATKKIVIKK